MSLRTSRVKVTAFGRLWSSGRLDALPVRVGRPGCLVLIHPPAPPRSFGGCFHIANRYSQAEKVEDSLAGRSAEVAWPFAVRIERAGSCGFGTIPGSRLAAGSHSNSVPLEDPTWPGCPLTTQFSPTTTRRERVSRPRRLPDWPTRRSAALEAGNRSEAALLGLHQARLIQGTVRSFNGNGRR
jgi:hypothetical protein